MSRIGNLSSRIFVGGLDPAVNESDLEKAFALFGEITNVMVMRDRENGRSRGFAFISFKDSMSSEDAISRMHGVEIRGRCVTVRHAERERFLDDKNQAGTAGPVRGKGGPVAGLPSRDSQYGGYKAQPSKIVFVTDDDQDYPRTGGASYRRRRSASPGNPGFSTNADNSKQYRERSPHNRYGRQNPQRSYYEDNSGNAAGRLSPTEELSAYVNSRYRDYSPQPEFAKERRTDSTDYRRNERGNQNFYHSHAEERSDGQEHRRSSYEQQRQYRSSNEQRRSPDTRVHQKSQGSFSRTSTGQGYGDSQRRGDLRDERRPRNLGDSRRSVGERNSPERVQSSRSYGRDQSPDAGSSWERNKRQRTPQNSYREWNQGATKTFRDQGRDRTNNNYQRGRNEDFQRSRRPDVSDSRRSDNNFNGGGSRWNRDSRESNSYQPKHRSYDYKEQQRDSRQDRNAPSTQSWKRESGRSFDRSKDFQRTDEYRSSGNYQKSRYQDEDKGHGRGSELYHDGSGRSQASRDRYQNNRGRRY